MACLTMKAGPTLIRMQVLDNVAIVGNEGGLPAGTRLPGGVTLLDKAPQAHKVLLQDLPAGGEVLVLSLGCEKLQPERLMPAGTIPLMSQVRL